jgi:hypothetical protein
MQKKEKKKRHFLPAENRWAGEFFDAPAVQPLLAGRRGEWLAAKRMVVPSWFTVLRILAMKPFYQSSLRDVQA